MNKKVFSLKNPNWFPLEYSGMAMILGIFVYVYVCLSVCLSVLWIYVCIHMHVHVPLCTLNLIATVFGPDL